MKKYLIGTALITVSGLVSLPAHAQLTDEIIVTATKKSTNLQDTAVSVRHIRANLYSGLV